MLEVLLIVLMQLIIVPLATLRTILVVKGNIRPASLIGGIEALIYVISLSLIFSDLSNYQNMLGYALGYSCGILLGGFIEKKLAIGYRMVIVNLPTYNKSLIQDLRDKGFGVTVFKGEGREKTTRFRLDVLVNRSREQELIEFIKNIEPTAFLVSYEPTSFKGGYLVSNMKKAQHIHKQKGVV